MKSFFFVCIALILVAVSVFFFWQCGGLLSERNYLAGLLHIFVGFATIRGGIEFARLAVVSEGRT